MNDNEPAQTLRDQIEALTRDNFVLRGQVQTLLQCAERAIHQRNDAIKARDEAIQYSRSLTELDSSITYIIKPPADGA